MTHQLLFCADDNFLRANRQREEKTLNPYWLLLGRLVLKEMLIKEAHVEQKAVQSHNNRQVITNLLRVWQPSEHLGRTLTNQNYIYEEIKCRVNSRNACCPSV